MRRAVDQAQAAAAGRKASALLPEACVETLDGQSLVPSSIAVLAAHAQRELSLPEPIGHLAELFAIRHVHSAEDFFDELRAEVGVIIEKLHRLPQSSEHRIERDDAPRSEEHTSELQSPYV